MWRQENLEFEAIPGKVSMRPYLKNKAKTKGLGVPPKEKRKETLSLSLPLPKKFHFNSVCFDISMIFINENFLRISLNHRLHFFSTLGSPVSKSTQIF
jgi:hypothetical protein